MLEHNMDLSQRHTALAMVMLAGAMVSAGESPSVAVRQAGEEFLRTQLEESPLLRLRRGLPVERLTDLTAEHERRVAERARVLRSRLDAVRDVDLDRQDTLSLIVLRRQLQAVADAPRFRGLRIPVTPYASPLAESGQLFGRLPLGDAPARERYRFNGSSLADRSLLNAGALIAHELVPGHHFQINLAFEIPDLPEFRRETLDTAYTEGWGDYASAVAGEMGMYEDPYDLYGRLAMEMFISVRLVVDTGMNALRWSRARAMEYMREHGTETETQIASETLRYCCDIPGQALAYKMGSLRIRALRDEAQAALGPRFDIRRFHDAVLDSGSLPMPALVQRVRWFIEDERAR